MARKKRKVQRITEEQVDAAVEANSQIPEPVNTPGKTQVQTSCPMDGKKVTDENK